MSHDHRFIAVVGIVWAALLVVSLGTESPQFRPSDALRDPSGPMFIPSVDVVQDRRGDLDYKSRLSEFRQVEEIRFRTDEHGYRNPSLSHIPRVVMLGDSFVVGVSLDEAATVTARMTELLGEPVYNFGCYDGEYIPRYLADARFESTPPTVALLVMGARQTDNIRTAPRVRATSWWAREPPLSWLVTVPGMIFRWKRPLERDNRLTHLARRAIASIRYQMTGELNKGRVLIVEGEKKLVLTLDEQKLYASSKQRRLEATVDAIAAFHHELHRRGTKLVFAQVPEPGLLYEDLYTGEAPMPRPRFHDLLYRELAGRGVACVNLLEALGPQRLPYLFQATDTHWNPRGVDLAARALVEHVRPHLE